MIAGISVHAWVQICSQAVSTAAFYAFATTSSVMFSPIDYFGPIAGREMLIVARRRRYSALRFAYGLFLLFIAYDVWQRFAGDADMRTMPRLAASVVETVGWWQIVICALLAPVLLCDALSSERRGRNLDILLTTCLEPAGIVRAKLCSRLLVIVQMLAIAVPFVSLMSLFGGVPVMKFCVLTLVALAAAAATGSLAMMFSVRTESPLRALLGTVVRLTWVGLAAAVFVPAFVDGLGRTGPRRGGRSALGWEIALWVIIAAGAAIAVSLAFVAACRWLDLLKSEMEVENKTKRRREPSFIEQWNDKALERFLGSRNPLWTDRKLDYAPRGRMWFWRPQALAAASAGFTALSYFTVTELAQSLGYLAAWLLFMATCLLLPFVVVLAASNPLLDRRQDLWSLLRTTDLTNHELLRGAVLGLWPVVFWMMCGYATLAFAAVPTSPGEMIAVLAVTLSQVLMLVMVGTVTLLPERPVSPPQLPTVFFVALLFLWPFPISLLDLKLGADARIAALGLGLLAATFGFHTRSRYFVAVHLAVCHVVLTLACAALAARLGVETSAWQLAPGYWIFRGPADLGSFVGRSRPFEPAFGIVFASSLLTALWAWIYAHLRFDAFCERPGALQPLAPRRAMRIATIDPS